MKFVFHIFCCLKTAEGNIDTTESIKYYQSLTEDLKKDNYYKDSQAYQNFRQIS